jgi:hypothetical protein
VQGRDHHSDGGHGASKQPILSCRACIFVTKTDQKSESNQPFQTEPLFLWTKVTKKVPKSVRKQLTLSFRACVSETKSDQKKWPKELPSSFYVLDVTVMCVYIYIYIYIYIACNLGEHDLYIIHIYITKK